MKNSLKQISKNTKGITLMALVITIVLLLILASISVYSGVNVVKSSRFTSFTAELKIMQTQINEMYQKYTDGGSIDVGGNTYQGEEILNIGKDISSTQDVTDQANFVFTSEESGITDKEGYKYFDLQTIKDLNIEGVEGEFFINVQKRSVISYDGFNYENERYYTLEQIPNGFYNVEYEENINKPTFDLAVETIEDGKWRITISNIQYNGYINKWEVKYRIDGQEHWNTSEDLSFIVTEEGMYNIYIGNGNIQSDTKKKAIGVALPQPEKGGTPFERTVGTTDIVFLSGTSYNEGEANEPLLDSNTMIPIKHNGTNWVVTTASDPDWYNYDTEERKWANVMLTDGKYKVGDLKAGDTVAEDDLGSMFVWIPRYAYKISYFNNEDDKKAYIQNREDKSKIIGYSDARGIVDTEGKVPSDITEDQITSIAVGDNYRPHPVFEEDVTKGGWGKKTTGIWVGKFETTTTTSTNGTNMILPNKASQRALKLSTSFSKSQAIGTTLNMTLDSHVMKNMEWGATAYLAESKYGRNGTEVSVNQCEDYITGAGRGVDGTNPIYNSTYTSSSITPEQKYNGNIGMLSSTTGNIYGIYDMSGGAFEHVMGFYGTAENTPSLGSSGFSSAPERKYYDLYINKTLESITVGDALYETKRWNDDGDYFLNSSFPVFNRGCNYYSVSDVGLFYFNNGSGSFSSVSSFRVCLAVK